MIAIPNTSSAEKRLRQNWARRERNRARKLELRRRIKELEKAVRSGDQAKAQELIPQLERAADKAAQRRVIHPNKAARLKSRLMRRVQSLS